MSKTIEPPAFVSDTKTYAEYKQDLEMWSRITGLDAKIQAEMVVYRLEGHPSRIKEKIMTQIGDKIKDNAEGIKELLKFLDTIYDIDDMADAWDKFTEFSSFSRKVEQSIPEFIADWTNCYYKLKSVGCEYPDMILGFKLLQDAKLNDMETKLVLTGVDYAEGKSKKNLEKQIIDSLKKFKGRAVIGKEGSVDVKVETTWLSQVEEVLLSKGWKPPNKNSSYKGKKNPLGDNSKPLKCYLCKCEHAESCNCPCVYHLANKCPNRRKKAFEDYKGQRELKKPDLGLFVNTNIESAKSDGVLLVEEDDDFVLVVKEPLNSLVLLSVERHEAVVDCACPTTVTGKKWIESFFEDLDEESKCKVKVEESERMFKFGGGEKRKSRGLVTFPCHIAGKNVKIRSEVVDADFPLLIGNSMLKKAGAVLFLREEKAVIMGCEVKMRETMSGHFSLKVDIPKKDLDFVKIVDISVERSDNDCMELYDCLMTSEGELTRKDVEKLHHLYGHMSIRKLEELIKRSKKLSKEVKGYLEDVESKCKSCKLNQKSKPKPAVGLPRASRFNQIVTMDLKHYTVGTNKYILYLVDMFSRLTVGVFITDKNPATIGAKIMEKWVSVFGRMEMIHSDRGGEFNCEELADIADYLGIKSTYTAAYSPNQNGMNERNHEIVDRMMAKILMQDPSLSPEVAFTWALAAKNTLQNVSGFSSFQIVFGQAPSLPSVYTAGPPGLEEVVMSKAVADHINALHLAREAYIEGESDRVLKAALKQRIYTRGNDVQAGDWIYFKNKKKWEGPVKVTTKDGKSLYAVRGGKLLTINTDHAQLAIFEGHFVRQPDSSKNMLESTVCPQELYTGNSKIGEEEEEDADNGMQKDNIQNNSATAVVLEPEVREISSDQSNLKETAEPEISKVIPTVPDDIRKNDVIKFQRNEGADWVQGRVLCRAGKKGGMYDKWWNVRNMETGHIQPEDLGKVEVIEKVLEESVIEESCETESVYVSEIPRYRYHEEVCKAAKEKELESWDKYEVYEEVNDEGQVRIGTNWVLTEKVLNGVSKIKARLTIRGDQEETAGIRKDSPTVRKGNIKIFTAVAAKEHWKIKTSDVACAFLQGVGIKREVFVLPPKEKRIPGVVWRLLKPVYGLVDAPRGWHLALDKEIIEAGCEKCQLDPAMYLHFSMNENVKKLEGIVLTHVDDLLHGGSKMFQDNVMTTVKSSFKFGLDESESFRYVGMNMIQTEDGIVIDQDHYVKSLELPDMEVACKQKVNEVLSADGQTVFRGCVAKILHVGYQSRPDVCFDAKCLSSKFGKATKGDLKSALKKIQKLQGQHTKMFFPSLGPVEEWSFVGYGDAGVRSMPDKISSVGGQVVIIANSGKGVACVLSWRSEKLVRKVVSALAGEALAVGVTIGEIVYNKASLKQIYGDAVDKVPVILFTIHVICMKLFTA